MKSFILSVLFLVLGAGGAWVYLNASEPKASEPAEDLALACGALLQGTPEEIARLPRCTKHQIPQAICAFCDPALAEQLGFCHGHDVPEAFCTRCSPILIAAFKAENDWCAEHELPESQCALCKGDNYEHADIGKGADV